jgi:tetratricopeptide (TPR) repeat protein
MKQNGHHTASSQDDASARIGYYLILGLLMLIAGCHHSQALYEGPQRSPLEEGRIAEQDLEYADAAEAYSRIDEMVVRDMTLNQLSTAWNNVNANIIHAQRQVQQSPRDAEAHLRLAKQYYSKGLLCTRYTTGIVGSYPHDFVMNEQEYWYRQALEHAQRALRLQPDLPETRLLIGEIYLANNCPDDALTTLKDLIVRSPDFARGYYAIGKVYFDMQATDKIERYLIRTLKLDPDLHDAYYLLGKFYLEQDLYDYAAYTFLELLRRDPHSSPALDLLIEACHELGKYYLEQEAYNRAIVLFQEILRVQPTYDVHQSFLLARQKRKEAELAAVAEAAEAARKAEEAAGVQTDTSQFKAFLFADQSLGTVLSAIQSQDPDLTQALQHFETQDFDAGYNVLQAEPDKNLTNPLRTLAVAFAARQLGRDDEAVQHLRRLANTPTVDTRLRLWAYSALRSMGEQPEQEIADLVMGVVIEVSLPDKNGVDVLAAYADGAVRYINYSGQTITREQGTGEIARLARDVIQTAQPLVLDFPPEQQRLDVKPNNIRISLLTCGGVRVLEDNATRIRQQGSVMSPIFEVGTTLLEELIASYTSAA